MLFWAVMADFLSAGASPATISRELVVYRSGEAWTEEYSAICQPEHDVQYQKGRREHVTTIGVFAPSSLMLFLISSSMYHMIVVGEIAVEGELPVCKLSLRA